LKNVIATNLGRRMKVMYQFQSNHSYYFIYICI